MENPEPSAPRAALREWIAIPLLVVGGIFIPVVGWLVGVYLLWTSKIWSRRDKLIGALVFPGGLLPALVVGSIGRHTCAEARPALDHDVPIHCAHPLSVLERTSLVVALVVLIALPIASALHLALRARRAENAS